MPQVVDVLHRRAGTATYAELRALVSARSIRMGLADGAIRRIAKGVYALPPVPDPLAAARAQGGLVSHLSGT